MAFERACSERDFEVAEYLFRTLEAIAVRETNDPSLDRAYRVLVHFAWDGTRRLRQETWRRPLGSSWNPATFDVQLSQRLAYEKVRFLTAPHSWRQQWGKKFRKILDIPTIGMFILHSIAYRA
jgi:hypothetical protein